MNPSATSPTSISPTPQSVTRNPLPATLITPLTSSKNPSYPGTTSGNKCISPPCTHDPHSCFPPSGCIRWQPVPIKSGGVFFVSFWTSKKKRKPAAGVMHLNKNRITKTDYILKADANPPSSSLFQHYEFKITNYE